MTRNRRHLAPEEEALWEAVKRTAVPLHRPAAKPEPAKPPSPEAAAPPPPDISASSQHPVPPKAPPPRGLPSLQPLDRREKKKLGRGTMGIDGKLDLHGFRQDEARARLQGFLAAAQARGDRIVLVITGKGKSDGGSDTLYGAERGVLRRVVPLWLTLPEFRALVLGFEEAHLAHGGLGALYIRIRRRGS